MYEHATYLSGKIENGSKLDIFDPHSLVVKINPLIVFLLSTKNDMRDYIYVFDIRIKVREEYVQAAHFLFYIGGGPYRFEKMYNLEYYSDCVIYLHGPFEIEVKTSIEFPEPPFEDNVEPENDEEPEDNVEPENGEESDFFRFRIPRRIGTTQKTARKND